jgi:hypothetical protein
MIVGVIAHPNATTKPPLSFTADCLQPGQILFSIDEIEFRSTCWVIEMVFFGQKSCSVNLGKDRKRRGAGEGRRGGIGIVPNRVRRVEGETGRQSA